MKRLLGLMLCMTLFISAYAQEPAKPVEQERMFFPRDTFWGYAQFDFAGPHNEIDPNICRADAGDFGGKNAPCSAFARYMLSGVVEIRPFGRGIFRRFMIFGEPKMFLGKNIPQTLYTYSFDAIGVERDWGIGLNLGKGFEFRATSIFYLNGSALATLFWGMPILDRKGLTGVITLWAYENILGHGGGDETQILKRRGR